MSIFNLKLAMADWGIYRKAYEWWSLDDVLAGKNEHFNNWAKINRSLKPAILEILHAKQKFSRRLQRRFGLTAAQVEKFHKVYVGYSPLYGIYACHVGPYMKPPNGGNDVADSLNKFSYFEKRYRTANQSDVIASLEGMLAKQFAEYKDLLSFSDFGLLALQETETPHGDPKSDTWDGKWKKKKIYYSNLDPSSPEGSKLYHTHPILASGSAIIPNASGFSKILTRASENGNWGNLLQEAIAEVAKQNGVSIEEAKVLMYKDEKVVKSVFDTVGKIHMEMIEKGDPAAKMIQIPKLKNLLKIPKIGAQIPQTLRVKPIQISSMKLKLSILEAITEVGGTDNIEALMSKLNEIRAKKIHSVKAKGMFTPELINYWINYLNADRNVKDQAGNVIGQKSWAGLLEEAQDEFNQLMATKKTKEIGFDDFETAIDMASLYFAEENIEQVDPLTRGKMMTYINVPPVFDKGENFVNTTRQELAVLREEQTKKNEAEGKAPEEIEKSIAVDIGEDEGAEEIGAEDSEDIGDIEVTDITEQDQVAQETTPISQQPQSPIVKTEKPKPVPPAPIEEKKKETEDDMDIDIGSLVSNSLRSMIKIARELDDEGNFEAAEEIHKIIRKYI